MIRGFIGAAVFCICSISMCGSSLAITSYTESDAGSACKLGTACGTVTKDRTLGSTTYVCKKGGPACGSVKASGALTTRSQESPDSTFIETPALPSDTSTPAAQ